MKIFLLCCILCCSILEVSGQEITATLEGKTPLSGEHFIGIDKYGSRYTTKNNTLLKTTDGKTYQFSDLQLGHLSTVDILNPLKIVLFYQNMNTAVLLDDKLSEITRINFNLIANYRSVDFVTKANQHRLWVLNADAQELELFNYQQRKVEAHSHPLSGKIIQQVSDFNYCWLLTNSQLLRYNAYGSFMNALPAEGIAQIAYHNGRLMSLKGEKLMILLKNENDFRLVSIPEIKVKAFYLADENLYIYDGTSLYHYILNLPN